MNKNLRFLSAFAALAVALALPTAGVATPISALTAQMQAPGTGYNHIGFNIKDPNNLDLGVDGEYAVPVFLRGGFNDWSTDNELIFDGIGAYEVTMDIGVGLWEFKIASEDWSTVDLGSGGGDPNVSLGTPYAMGTGAFGNLVIDISAAGMYTFLLDTSDSLNTPTLLVSSVLAVAEPGMVALFGFALLGLGAARRLRKKH